MKTYRKTATIQAEQFDEVWWLLTLNSCNNLEEWNQQRSKLGIDAYHGHFVISTPRGDMRINNGDWIATGVKGEVNGQLRATQG